MAEKRIDPRTGFPVGFHGGYSHAVDYALDADRHESDPANQLAFLQCWREGNLDEWPEYYDWLRSIGVTG